MSSPKTKDGKFFQCREKGIKKQATASQNFWRWPRVNGFGVMSGFETIQILLHRGVINAQEFVGGSHYVDAIGFALGAFLVHELVHRFIGRRTLKNHAHHKKQ